MKRILSIRKPALLVLGNLGALLALGAGCAAEGGSDPTASSTAALMSTSNPPSIPAPSPVPTSPVLKPKPVPTAPVTQPAPPTPTPIAGNPQGLTAGFSYVNQDCGLSFAGILETVGTVVEDAFLCPLDVAGCIVTLGGFGCPSGGTIGAVNGGANDGDEVFDYACGGFLQSSPSSCGIDAILSSPANGMRTLWQNQSNFTASAAPGWHVGTDGDIGLGAQSGFYHQELLGQGVGGNGVGRYGAVPAVTDSFALPKGSACGFHHTQVDPPDFDTSVGLCMGYDAALYCPTGWTQRFMFDDGSGDGSLGCGPSDIGYTDHCGYWVWCEYQDPHGFGESTASFANAAALGVALDISSDTDATGVSGAGQACPAGWTRSPYFDNDRPSGQGLSSCLAPNPPAYKYVFASGDARGDTSTGDWSPGNYKAECGIAQEARGLSMLTGGSAHELFCAPGTPELFDQGKSNCHDVAFAASDDRVTAATGDWDPGFYKGECGTNEYVAGVSQSTTGAIQSVLCCADSSDLHLSCKAEVFAGADARESTTTGDWDYSYNKGECGDGRYVAGVSHDASGHPHAILCCGDQ
jgi:hypothetical protein